MLSLCQTAVEKLSVIKYSNSQAKKGYDTVLLNTVIQSDLFLKKKMVASSTLLFFHHPGEKSGFFKHSGIILFSPQ